jgi:hypothetical protein
MYYDIRMEFRKPLNATAIIGNRRYHTEGATLLAVLYSNEDTDEHAYLFHTANGRYFLQTDKYILGWNAQKKTGISEIKPLEVGDAARYYEMTKLKIVSTFPDQLDEA